MAMRRRRLPRLNLMPSSIGSVSCRKKWHAFWVSDRRCSVEMAGDASRDTGFSECCDLRDIDRAAGEGLVAPWMEMTAGRRILRAWRIAFEHDPRAAFATAGDG